VIKLYHADAYGFPQNAQSGARVLTLNYTYHARQAAQSDRYGAVDLPATLDTGAALLIEAEIDSGGALVKAVWRVRYDNELDLVLVVIPASATVKTVWINRHNDTHRTLDKSRYARP
jgi:hypothetical protein